MLEIEFPFYKEKTISSYGRFQYGNTKGMTFFLTDKETDPYTLTGGDLSTVYLDKDGNKVSFVKVFLENYGAN